MRHTYSSLLLTDGAPIAYLSEQPGHSSIDLTVKRYGHLLPGAEIASSDAADALAVAICHAHHRASSRRWTDAASQSGARAREDALP